MVSRSRSRSPSPLRKPKYPKEKKYSGLKWKENTKPRAQDDTRPDRHQDYSRQRDDHYSDRRDVGRRDRNHEQNRNRYGNRDRDRDDRRRDDRYSDRKDSDRYSDRKDSDRYSSHRDSDPERRDSSRRDSDRSREERDRDRRLCKPRETQEHKAPPAPQSIEPMIIVTINDRLGTKTQVPCVPSDPIKVLKAMVAAKIGRPVHEIMLKRQGERPFHDSLTLADYSISNGVQIDLELNTGD